MSDELYLNVSKVYYSDFVLEELKNKLNQKVFEESIEVIKKQLIYVGTTKYDIVKAKNLSKTINLHFADSLHLVLAIRENCIFITRDKHFEEIDLIEIIKPEEFSFS